MFLNAVKMQDVHHAASSSRNLVNKAFFAKILFVTDYGVQKQKQTCKKRKKKSGFRAKREAEVPF